MIDIDKLAKQCGFADDVSEDWRLFDYGCTRDQLAHFAHLVLVAATSEVNKLSPAQLTYTMGAGTWPKVTCKTE